MPGRPNSRGRLSLNLLTDPQRSTKIRGNNSPGKTGKGFSPPEKKKIKKKKKKNETISDEEEERGGFGLLAFGERIKEHKDHPLHPSIRETNKRGERGRWGL